MIGGAARYALGVGKIDWNADYELAEGLRFVDELATNARVAYVADHAVFVRRVGARRRRRLVSEGNQSVACPLVFSPDGRTVYHAHAQLQAIDVRSREVRSVTAFDEHREFSVGWDLQISPDSKTLFFRQHSSRGEGRKRWHARFCAIDTDGTHFRVLFDPPADLGGLWRASCDFERGLINLVLTGASSGLRRFSVELDGSNLRERAVIRYGLAAPDLSNEFDLPFGDIVGVPRVPDRGEINGMHDAASLSPDRRSVAFMRDEHELWDWRFDEPRPRCLLRARGGTELNAFGGWATAPRFSPDGSLLWFASTVSKRRATSRWTRKHRTGFVDLTSNAVWMLRGHWRGLAFMPS